MARRRALVTAALTAAAALLLPTAAAQAAPPSYVALGDSYSSGTGTGSYLLDGTDCLRSAYAYPSLIASSSGYALNLRACSGATVADVANSQLGALSASTAYVTISVGGNDAGFADVLTECALPSWLSDCYGAIDDARAVISTILPARLDSLYAQIRARAPYAQVTVVGYPRIFNGKDCSWLTWFSSTEESRLNSTADLLNNVMSGRAGAAGFSFADPTSRFLGHAVCDSQAWINNLSATVVESYHPNKAGHASGYAPTVSPYVTGSTLTVTGRTLRTASRTADAQAALQRGYADLDAAIEPAVVRAPDLTTARARAAAERAGVDLGSRASIDAADRRYDRAQARAAGLG
jgi:lysophospholipase L1-like esterase